MDFKKSLFKDEKGILTVDFIFAFIIIFGFVGVLFSFAITFSVVEAVQYVSFASARNFSLAHLNEDRQKERADEKYDELTTSQALSPFFSNGWFEIKKSDTNEFNDVYEPEPGREIFIGVRVLFKAPILFKRIPLLGTTASNPDGFSVNIQSFLMREPTFQECKDFISGRINEFKKLPNYNFISNQSYKVMMDNGC